MTTNNGMNKGQVIKRRVPKAKIEKQDKLQL